jgi:hypothetical protein
MVICTIVYEGIPSGYRFSRSWCKWNIPEVEDGMIAPAGKLMF